MPSVTPRIPINDLSRTLLRDRDEIEAAVAAVLTSGWLVHGQQHRLFEEEFAAYCGSGHCIGVANGTDALTIALRAVGVQSGDRVCTVANAGFYASTACLSIGATPLYVDVDAATLNMSPLALARALEQGPSAVVATHLYGGMVKIEEIANLCAAAGVPLVEDCAQATGACLASGRKAGTFGTAAAFSFYPTKNLGAIGDGGAIVTDLPTIAERCQDLRQYGWKARYVVHGAGVNSRLDEIQAAVLRIRLRDLDRRNSRRQTVLHTYQQALGEASAAGRLVYWHDSTHVAYLAVLRTQHRDALQAHLDRLGISTDVHYPIPDDQQPLWGDVVGYVAADDLAVTHTTTTEILSIPSFPELRDDEVDRIADALVGFADEA